MNDRKSERRRKKNCTFLLCLLSIIFHMPRHIYTSIYMYIQLDTRIIFETFQLKFQPMLFLTIYFTIVFAFRSTYINTINNSIDAKIAPAK